MTCYRCVNIPNSGRSALDRVARMRKLIALLAIASLLAAIGAVSAFGATKTVKWKVGSKTTQSIRKGGTVKWVWSDGAPHNVKGPGFKSKTATKIGTAYTHKFGSKGTFKITCQVHPTTMKTVVKVS
jgi:plastocyanin